MTRRTHACIGCAGAPGDTPFNKPRRTRHADRVCSFCRRRGVRVEADRLIVPVTVDYRGRGA